MGYQYTGPTSLYLLTWIEIFQIVDAAGLREQEEISEYDERTFSDFNERLRKQKHGHGP